MKRCHACEKDLVESGLIYYSLDSKTLCQLCFQRERETKIQHLGAMDSLEREKNKSNNPAHLAQKSNELLELILIQLQTIDQTLRDR